MIRIFLSESIFNESGCVSEIALSIDETDLKTMIKIAKNNNLDFAILHDNEE